MTSRAQRIGNDMRNDWRSGHARQVDTRGFSVARTPGRGWYFIVADADIKVCGMGEDEVV